VETSARQHEEQAARERPRVQVAVVTVSDTRTPETDISGQLLREQLASDGHTITFYRIVPDDGNAIRAALAETVETEGCDGIIFNGGTGISRRDTTFDVIDGLLDKRLPGFGELFRALSYADIGPAAMLSRATAGTYHQRLVISIPGSSAAVRLALDKLIRPELAHLVWELIRQG